jgi:uncharacterized SAM-binding protein YcdF (DUF218 family)
VDIVTIYLLKALILPPASNLLAIAVAVAIRRRSPRLSRGLFGIAFWSLLLFAIPLISTELARPLQNFPAFDPDQGADGAAAIVILGGGRYYEAPEYRGRDTVHQRTLARLRYGAYLAQELRLPVGLIGGDATGAGLEPEGKLMQEVMRDSFKTPVQWVETRSRNTAENALYARQMIPARIILVTNAMHMTRSRRMFEQAGFDVIPAPIEFTVYPPSDSWSVFDYLPSIGGLLESHYALHEYLGILWYWLRYRT